jgi:primosomal protein N' (replication factor Y)
MANYARVVVESDLLQLDREFDFLVPEHLSQSVRVGQRVKFQLGRTKKLASGFISSLPLESSFATSELVEIVDLEPVVTEEIFKLARQVANRQAVALGEILQHAVVEHMPRIPKPLSQPNQEVVVEVPEIPGITSLPKRSAVLTSARSLTHEGMRYPDWCWLFLRSAIEAIQSGKSAILIVPERDQISQLAALFSSRSEERRVGKECVA